MLSDMLIMWDYILGVKQQAANGLIGEWDIAVCCLTN